MDIRKRVEFKATVEKDLRRLDPSIAKRILNKLEKMAVSGFPDEKALSGEFQGMYRTRVGDYRVVYAKASDAYLVLRIAHRKDVYD